MQWTDLLTEGVDGMKQEKKEKRKSTSVLGGAHRHHTDHGMRYSWITEQPPIQPTQGLLIATIPICPQLHTPSFASVRKRQSPHYMFPQAPHLALYVSASSISVSKLQNSAFVAYTNASHGARSSDLEARQCWHHHVIAHLESSSHTAQIWSMSFYHRADCTRWSTDDWRLFQRSCASA